MITIVKNEKIRSEKNETFIVTELRGLSTDTKPTTIDGFIIDNGSTYLEIDTGSVFIFNYASKSWVEV